MKNAIERIKVGPEDIGRVVIMRHTLRRGVIISFCIASVRVHFNGQKTAWDVSYQDIFYDETLARPYKKEEPA